MGKEYCVTGGTGFIAAYLVKALLLDGHVVRATVRDPGDMEKVGFLWKLKGAKERLKLVKADLLAPGSFDDAVRGVDGVFHTASPVLVPYDHNIQASYLLYDLSNGCRATLIDPCIKGTLNVLTSCSKSKTVKRVVLTSSCSSIRYRYDAHQVSPLNESHWTDLDYCKSYNVLHSSLTSSLSYQLMIIYDSNLDMLQLWYAFAKTTAEKEAWMMAQEHGIDLVVVNPSFVVGPLLGPQPTSTLLLILAIVKGLRGEIPNTALGFVHIEDVIATHILAMEDSRASGRLSSTKGDSNTHSMDTSKIAKLGLPPFRSLEEMFDDCIKSFQDKGFLLRETDADAADAEHKVAGVVLHTRTELTNEEKGRRTDFTNAVLEQAGVR
ncbi:Tetraketide alpha-pyrone reductase 2 [Linum grandiflorum]